MYKCMYKNINPKKERIYATVGLSFKDPITDVVSEGRYSSSEKKLQK